NHLKAYRPGCLQPEELPKWLSRWHLGHSRRLIAVRTTHPASIPESNCSSASLVLLQKNFGVDQNMHAQSVMDITKRLILTKFSMACSIVRYLFLVPAIVPLKPHGLPRNTDHTLADNCLDVPVLDNSLIGELGLDQSPACGNLQIGGHYEGTVYCGRRRRNASPGFRDGAGFIADLS